MILFFPRGETFISSPGGASAQCDELESPLVFDAVFYLNNHPDLYDAGIRTREAAIDHWCTDGVDQGRQATNSFHSLQYLEKYVTFFSMHH